MEKFIRTKINSSKFRIKAKNVFLTYPNCPLTKEIATNLLQQIPSVQGIIVAEEQHSSGQPHLHAVVSLSTVLDTQNCRYFDLTHDGITYHGNYSGCFSTSHAVSYCKKGGVFFHWGFIGDNSNQSKIQKRALFNKACQSHSLSYLVDNNIISFTQVKAIKQAKDILALEQSSQNGLVPRLCLWIHGKSGSGKSTYVRNTFSDNVYFKDVTKWWDGYTDQKVVLLEDFDHSNVSLAHYLKIWADQFRFTGETKGGSVIPNYNFLIVTSNYTPSQLWGPSKGTIDYDNALLTAINRRFIVATITSNDSSSYFLTKCDGSFGTPLSLVDEMQLVKDNLTNIKSNTKSISINTHSFIESLNLIKNI